MKEAIWGLGLLMLCLLTFVIIAMISNVSLTNQQDYYGLKQTSEASAYESIDVVAYKKGICVCSVGINPNQKGTYIVKSKKQYTITEPNENNECDNPTSCELRLGEYVIDPNLFVESMIVRLGAIIKPTEVYDVKIQEVIPYPPKISVYISYHQALNVEGKDTIDSEIPNNFDGIFEDNGKQSVLKYQKTVLETWPLTCDEPDEEKKYCYYDGDGSLGANKWRWCPTFNGENCVKDGYESKIEAKSEKDCKNACMCYCNGGKCYDCGVWPDVNWPDREDGGMWTTKDLPKGSCDEACYKKYKNKENDEYELTWAAKSPGNDWEVTNIEKPNCRMACFVKEENGKKKYSWNGWGQWTGWVEDTTKTETTCKGTTTHVGGDCTNCNWFYNSAYPACGTYDAHEDAKTAYTKGKSSGTSSAGLSTSCNNKASAICGSTGVYQSNCKILQHYTVCDNRLTENKCSKIDATSAFAAKKTKCGAGNESYCSACCYND